MRPRKRREGAAATQPAGGSRIVLDKAGRTQAWRAFATGASGGNHARGERRRGDGRVERAALRQRQRGGRLRAGLVPACAAAAGLGHELCGQHGSQGRAAGGTRRRAAARGKGAAATRLTFRSAAPGRPGSNNSAMRVHTPPDIAHPLQHWARRRTPAGRPAAGARTAHAPGGPPRRAAALGHGRGQRVESVAGVRARRAARGQRAPGRQGGCARGAQRRAQWRARRARRPAAAPAPVPAHCLRSDRAGGRLCRGAPPASAAAFRAGRLGCRAAATAARRGVGEQRAALARAAADARPRRRLPPGSGGA